MASTGPTRGEIIANFMQLEASIASGVTIDNIQPIMTGLKDFVKGLLEQTETEISRVDTNIGKLVEHDQTLQLVTTELARASSKITDAEGSHGTIKEATQQLVSKVKAIEDIAEKHEGQFKIGEKNLEGQLGQLKAEMKATETRLATEIKASITSDLQSALTQIRQQLPQEGTHTAKDTSWRGIMDFRAVSNLRQLKTKAEFRLWNERLISALEQARPGVKAKLEDNIRRLNLGEQTDKAQEWNYPKKDNGEDNLDGVPERLSYEAISKDLHFVLQDKCEEPDGIARIRSAKDDGIKAYLGLYAWCLGRSGQELQSRAEYITHPPVPKSEGEVAGIMENGRSSTTS